MWCHSETTNWQPTNRRWKKVTQQDARGITRANNKETERSTGKGDTSQEATGDRRRTRKTTALGSKEMWNASLGADRVGQGKEMLGISRLTLWHALHENSWAV